MIKSFGLLINVSVLLIFSIAGLLAGGKMADTAREDTVRVLHLQDDIADSFIRRGLEAKVGTVLGLAESMVNEIDLARAETGLLIRNMAPALPSWVNTICIQIENIEECGRRNFVGAMVSSIMPGWAANLERKKNEQAATIEITGQSTAAIFRSPILSREGMVTAYADLGALIKSSLTGISMPGFTQIEVYDAKGTILHHPNTAYIGRTWDDIEKEISKSHSRGKESDDSAKKAHDLFINGQNGTTSYIDNSMGGTLVLSHYGPFPGIPGYFFVYNRGLEAGTLDYIAYNVLGALSGAVLGMLIAALIGYWRASEEKSTGLKRALTAKERNEAALKELAVMIDSVSSMLLVVDDTKKIVRMNKAMESFLKEKGKPVTIGLSCKETMPGELCGKCQGTGALMNGKPHNFETEIDGRHYLIYQTPYTAPAGQNLLIHVIEDITDLKSLKGALVKSEKRLSSALLAGSIAHEINNALTGAIGYADLLAASPDNEVLAAKTAGVLKSQLGKVILLSRNLQSLSRPPKPMKESININDLFSGLAERLSEMGVTKRFLVETRWEPGLPSIEGDPGMIEQALMNIILNAAFAMSDHGILRMGSEKTAGGVRLYVSDTGPGISQEVLDRLFEPFFTTKGEEGTGLGLYVTQQITQAHGGTVEVASKVGKGTTMSLNFPA